MAPIGLSVRPFAALIYSALGIWLCGAWAVDALGAEGAAFPAEEWETTTPEQAGLDGAKLRQAREYALTGEGSGLIVRGGKAVLSWGDTRRRCDLKSTTKSFGATAVGIAIADGKVRLDDKAADVHPSLGVPPEENRDTGWLKEITLLHLATQTAGFEKPGGYGRLLFRPGTKWHYSDAGPNWLAECVTLRYRRDLRDVMFDRVFTPLGITADDLTWRSNQYRPHAIDGIPNREFGAGIHANVDAMARVGYLYLRRGRWGGKQILPPDFIDAARQPPAWLVALPEHEPKSEHGDASKHYGLLWWNNADGALPPPVPRDAYWSWGLYDSLIVVIPSLDLVVARAGKSWERKKGAAHYDVLEPFLVPICGAVKDPPQDRPQAQGVRVRRIEWDPPHTIVRRAKGSDTRGTSTRATARVSRKSGSPPTEEARTSSSRATTASASARRLLCSARSEVGRMVARRVRHTRGSP